MKYFTYTTDGAIDGRFIQDLLPEHEVSHVEVSDEDYPNWFNFVVVDGVLTPKPADTAEVVLDAAKAQKWDSIKAARAAAEFDSFTWNNSVFDANAEASRHIQDAVQSAVIAQLLSKEFSRVWTLEDNTTVTLSGADMIQVGIALDAHVADAFAHATELRQLIDAITLATANDLELINW